MIEHKPMQSKAGVELTTFSCRLHQLKVAALFIVDRWHFDSLETVILVPPILAGEGGAVITISAGIRSRFQLGNQTILATVAHT
ncbi:hypothetical protein ICL81_05775 [Leucobacter sp. cx-328]|uniref:hypothetical protein n=1 Tax=unclassified Leucobacter TaxID=2621730 RepID=UPI00165DACAE|nr:MULTISPECIES: hypothetical protein [unclassified Leucobacter]MBC9944024.1 hypothetical protein [Leucobacter sp. cx-328]